MKYRQCDKALTCQSNKNRHLPEMEESQTIKEASRANFPPNLFLFSVLLSSLLISNNKSIATDITWFSSVKMVTC